LLDNIGKSRSTGAKDAVFYDFSPLPELAELRHAVYIGGKKVFSDDYLKQLTPLSLPFGTWTTVVFTLRAKGLQARTRDGSGRSDICVEAMEPTTRATARFVSDRYLGHHAEADQSRRQRDLRLREGRNRQLHALIAPFIHPSMDYKLLPR